MNNARFRLTRGRAGRIAQGEASRGPVVLQSIGLKFGGFAVALAGFVATESTAKAVVVPFNYTDAQLTTAGQAASNQGLFGAINAVHDSGATFHVSITMLTDLSGSPFTIQSAPTSGTYVDLGGFGQRSSPGGTFAPQDGHPAVVAGRVTTIASSFVDSNIYMSTTIVNVNTDGGAGPGDSGGRFGSADGPMAIISGGTGNGQGANTYAVQIAPLTTKIENFEAQFPAGTLFGLAAAHSKYDPIDPVTFSSVVFGDYNDPTSSFKVIGTLVDPSWQGNAFGAFNGNQTDVTYVALEAQSVPEPGSVAILGVMSLGLLRRRKR